MEKIDKISYLNVQLYILWFLKNIEKYKQRKELITTDFEYPLFPLWPPFAQYLCELHRKNIIKQKIMISSRKEKGSQEIKDLCVYIKDYDTYAIWERWVVSFEINYIKKDEIEKEFQKIKSEFEEMIKNDSELIIDIPNNSKNLLKADMLFYERDISNTELFNKEEFVERDTLEELSIPDSFFLYAIIKLEEQSNISIYDIITHPGYYDKYYEYNVRYRHEDKDKEVRIRNIECAESEIPNEFIVYINKNYDNPINLKKSTNFKILLEFAKSDSISIDFKNKGNVNNLIASVTTCDKKGTLFKSLKDIYGEKYTPHKFLKYTNGKIYLDGVKISMRGNS